MSPLTPIERTFLLDNTLDLLFTCLRTASGNDHEADASSRYGIFVAAQRYIESRLTHPDLCVEGITVAIGSSRSTLYRAFSEQGLTVADCIRERRLQLFLHMLYEAPDHVTITALAHRCGFGDIDHFGKLFKQRYGVSPMGDRRGRARGRQFRT